MSRVDAGRAKQQLEALLDELGNLRTANTRDTAFKQWRQNTLTQIQLLWPGDATRSDRFRRVPFSTPSNRFNAKLTREFFERGCAEATVLLRSLIDEIDQFGLPQGGAAGPQRSSAPGSSEDDFPVLDLPGGASAPAQPRPASRVASPMAKVAPDIETEPERSEPATSPRDVAAPPPPPASPPAASVSPASPSSTATPGPPRIPIGPVSGISLPPPPPPAKTPPAPSRSGVVTTGPSERRAERRKSPRLGAWARRNPTKARLKDMLGFTDEGGDAEAPAPPRSRAESPSAPSRDGPRGARPTPPPATPPPPAEVAEPPAAREESSLPPLGWELPASPLKPHAPEAQPPAGTPPRRRSPIVSIVAPEPLKPIPAEPSLEPSFADDEEFRALEHLESAGRPAESPVRPDEPHGRSAAEVDETVELTGGPMEWRDELPEPSSASVEPSEPYEHSTESTPTEEPLELTSEFAAPAEESAESDGLTAETFHDPESLSPAEEFLRTSPVLSSQARPIKRGRRRTDTQPPSPTAVALSAVVSEISHLGVPEGQRAQARAALLDLARQVDERSLDWKSLRECVKLVMHYPPLARRVLPLLVPYLDTAA